MAKSSKSQNSKFKTLIIIVAAILIILSFVLLLYNCTGKASKFAAIYNGKVITKSRSFILPYDGEAKLEFDNYEGELIIEVLPNVSSKTDFEYTVDGQAYKFSKTKLTSVFITEVTDGKFTITCKPGQYGLANVLLNAQSGSELTSEIPCMDYPFKLIAATTAGERLEFSFAQFDFRLEPDGGYVF